MAMAGTDESLRGRPAPWKVKAAVLVCALKGVIMTIKTPYVMQGTLQSLLGTGVFHAAIAASTMLGSWLMPRMARHCSQPVQAWFIHVCGLSGNTMALLMPDSLLPILPSSIVSPTSLGTPLITGCIEHFQASDEEALAWGRWATAAFAAASALAPIIGPLITWDMAPINLFCFYTDALVTLPMLAFPMPREPKERPAVSSAWSWARTLRIVSSQRAPVLWMLSWSLVQALEHSMLELVILVYVVTTLNPSLIHISVMVVLGQVMAPAFYSSMFGGQVLRLYSIAPRLLLLGMSLFMGFLRVVSFQVSHLSAAYLLTCAGALGAQAMGHIKGILWAELITQEEGRASKESGEQEGIAALRESVDAIVSLAAPFMAVSVFGTFSGPTLMTWLVILGASVILYGQVGLKLFLLSAGAKSKEE